MQFSNGNIYTGQFENDSYDGFGKLVQKNGSQIYEGEFKKGYTHGHGKLTELMQQTHFEGQFVCGCKSGYGKMKRLVHNRYIQEYEGGWLNNKYHGFGKNYSPNSRVPYKYKGHFKMGLRDGMG